MYTYSLTVSLEKQHEKEWLTFIREEHIPAMEETGYFAEVNLALVADPIPEENAVTYNIECRTQTMEQLRMYMANEARRIHGRHDQKFDKRFHAMDALLKAL